MWLVGLRRAAGILVLGISLVAAERSSAAEPAPASVWVVTHQWHTGIAMRTADVPPGRWPDADIFAGAEFVEVGWGDRDFWMAPRETIGLAVKAALFSRASVLRVLWFAGPVERSLAWSDVVELAVPRAGLESLVDFVAESYARTPGGRPIDLGPGPVPTSRFYLATGRYHLLNTSNRWTAAALGRAGIPIAASTLTAGGIMCQAARLGRPIRLREHCTSLSPAPGASSPPAVATPPAAPTAPPAAREAP
jgi:uncharacterized protein (TIGR02117 family)